MRCIDADNLIEELLDCPVDEEVAYVMNGKNIYHLQNGHLEMAIEAI